MITKPIGLYVHIPFCLRKCNYCDFCSFKIDDIAWQERYIDILCSEIESYKEKEIIVDSIFFGGGTPSLLSEDQFSRIVNIIRKSFLISPDTEFTIEANPKTLTREKLTCYASLGVNRLSLGLQSIHENEMKMLGRIHNYQDFIDLYRLARDCGITNINVDLMYGIPEQTMDSFSETLDKVIDLSPEHLSLYGLIIEDNTPFGRNPEILNLPSEDQECDMYALACERLASSGYAHYEISNYARDEKFCKHNLKYWLNQEFIGVGLAAYSYFNGYRFGNTPNIEDYLSGKFSDSDSFLRNTTEDEAYEFVMLALRLSQGFSLTEYRDRFGVDFLIGRERLISSFVDSGLMTITDDRVSLTEKGFYVSNSILTELI